MKKMYTDRQGDYVEREEYDTDTKLMLEIGAIRPAVPRPVTRKDMAEGRVMPEHIRKGLVTIID